MLRKERVRGGAGVGGDYDVGMLWEPVTQTVVLAQVRVAHVFRINTPCTNTQRKKKTAHTLIALCMPAAGLSLCAVMLNCRFYP